MSETRNQADLKSRYNAPEQKNSAEGNTVHLTPPRYIKVLTDKVAQLKSDIEHEIDLMADSNGKPDAKNFETLSEELEKVCAEIESLPVTGTEVACYKILFLMDMLHYSNPDAIGIPEVKTQIIESIETLSAQQV